MDHIASPASAEVGSAGCRRAARAAIAAVALVACAAGAHAAPLMFAETVMTGLANPRGLTFGPDGALYVAESGSGGDGPTIIAGNLVPLDYGTTGAISRLRRGVQERVVTDLPSFAPPSGAEAHGVQELAFGADGRLYATMGLGANPAELAKVAGEPSAHLAGTLAVIDGGTPLVFADIPAFEAANNPDGNNPDTNVYGIVPQGGGFLVTDAGANAVFSIGATGDISTAAVLDNQASPLFPNIGPPEYQAVPTGAARGPDGAFVFGQLTGFPFPQGAAQIFSLEGDTLSVIADGFTNVIDLAFGPDGKLYVLELDSDGLFGLLGPETTGSIWSVGAGGSRKLLLDGLTQPTGLAVGPRDDVYVSVHGFSPTDGSVIRLAPIPLPATLPALAAALGLLAWRSRRRR